MRLASDFLSHLLDVRGLSPRTAETYGDAIRHFEKTTGIDNPGAVTIRSLDSWLTRQALQGKSPNTRRVRAYAMRSFLRWAKSRGHIEHNPGLELIPPEETSRAIPTFTVAEILRLLFEFQEPTLTKGKRENDFQFLRRKRIRRAKAIRDSAMIGLCYACALRAEELGRLRVDDYQVNGRGVASIAVKGKRARAPVWIRVHKLIAGQVELWLNERRLSQLLHPALFCPVVPRRKAAADRETGISANEFGAILAERIAAVGIEAKGRRLTPHALRYSVASHIYARLPDLLKIGAFLRHRSPETTKRYIALGSSAAIMKSVVEALPFTHFFRDGRWELGGDPG